MQIKWTRSAATEQILAILDQVEELLPRYPKIGRVGRVEDTRELVIVNTKFIVMYRAEEKTIYILRVVHGARQWPSGGTQH